MACILDGFLVDSFFVVVPRGSTAHSSTRSDWKELMRRSSTRFSSMQLFFFLRPAGVAPRARGRRTKKMRDGFYSFTLDVDVPIHSENAAGRKANSQACVFHFISFTLQACVLSPNCHGGVDIAPYVGDFSLNTSAFTSLQASKMRLYSHRQKRE